jgi:glycosyltransferase involved in cell wall biosynthesis
MIWLASFPRSGNTFFRNILYQVYGLESSTFHRDPQYPVIENYADYPFVKTHLLPADITPSDPGIKKVYLVRDGRDALVSMAHHKKDIIRPGTDFYNNLLESILGLEDADFGGWSDNVKQWHAAADIIIRYEDLIADPIGQVERLRDIVGLPPAREDKLPSFEKLKFGQPKYGGERGKQQRAFRRGKSGSWRDEMPEELEQLFWDLHGDAMQLMGYERGKPAPPAPSRPYRILMEADKVLAEQMDGVKRYQEELIFGMLDFQSRLPGKWQIDFLLRDKIVSILEVVQEINKQRVKTRGLRKKEGIPDNVYGYERMLLRFKKQLKQWLPGPVYKVLSGIYRELPVRDALRYIRTSVAWNKLKKLDVVAEESYDLVHIPLPQNYYFASRFDAPFIVTVHDLTHKYFPDFHEKDNSRLGERGMKFIEQKAIHAIAVSQATMRDLCSEYDFDTERVTVVYEAADKRWFKPSRDEALLQAARDKYGLPAQPYLLSLSTIEPRKNLKNTIAAFLKYKEQSTDDAIVMVICGRKGWKVEEMVDPEHPHAKSIYFTGYVDEKELPVLLSNAVGLCYVAHYEGFGLPPLEAMQCGTPVIYGNNSAMVEVVADAGLPADSKDVQDIASQIHRLADSTGLQEELASKALRRANQFSWIRAAFETLNVYEKVIQDESSHHS